MVEFVELCIIYTTIQYLIVGFNFTLFKLTTGSKILALMQLELFGNCD